MPKVKSSLRRSSGTAKTRWRVSPSLATDHLSTSFFDLFRLSQRLKNLDEVPFRIAGEVKVGGPGFLWMTVPIDSKGTIPLVGTLDQLLFAPDEFWRQPGRFQPEEAPQPDIVKPTGR